MINNQWFTWNLRRYERSASQNWTTLIYSYSRESSKLLTRMLLYRKRFNAQLNNPRGLQSQWQQKSELSATQTNHQKPCHSRNPQSQKQSRKKATWKINSTDNSQQNLYEGSRIYKVWWAIRCLDITSLKRKTTNAEIECVGQISNLSALYTVPNIRVTVCNLRKEHSFEIWRGVWRENGLLNVAKQAARGHKHSAANQMLNKRIDCRLSICTWSQLAILTNGNAVFVTCILWLLAYWIVCAQ